MKIPGYYETLGKLNHWKEKYKEDTSRLKALIKKQINRIEELKDLLEYYNKIEWQRGIRHILHCWKENQDIPKEQFIKLIKEIKRDITG